MNQDSEALERMNNARARLCVPARNRHDKQGDFRFFGKLIHSFRFTERPAVPSLSLGPFPYVYYNPTYVKDRSIREIAGVLAEMVIMIMDKLEQRRGNRNPYLWALAALAAAGDPIVDQTRIGLPEESVYSGYWGLPKNLTAEQIYRKLDAMEEVPVPWTAFGPDGTPIEVGFKLTLGDLINPLVPGGGLLGERQPWEDEAEEQGPETPLSGFRIDPLLYEVLKREARQEMNRTEEQRPGTIPDWMLRLAGIKKKPINWRYQIQREVKFAHYHGGGTIKYSWRRQHPVQHIIGDDLVLPVHELRMARVGLVFDTSGSMDEDDLALGRGQVEDVLRQLCGKEGVTVIPTDWDAKPAQRVRSAHDLELIGGGGTNMGAGIRAAEKLHPRIDALVIVTDGITGWPRYASRKFSTIIVNVSRVWPSPAVKAAWPAPKWARVIEMFPFDGHDDDDEEEDED